MCKCDLGCRDITIPRKKENQMEKRMAHEMEPAVSGGVCRFFHVGT